MTSRMSAANPFMMGRIGAWPGAYLLFGTDGFMEAAVLMSMRRFLNLTQNFCNHVVRWLRASPNVWAYAILVALGLIVLAQAGGYHLSYVPAAPEDPLANWGLDWDPERSMVPEVAPYLLCYLRLFALLAGVIYHLRVVQVYPDLKSMIRPTWWICGYLAVVVLGSMLFSQWETRVTSVTGEVFSGMASAAHLLMMIGLVLAPPVAMMYYSSCKIMERYVLRSFLQPLVFCLVAFFTLWVVMDLLDNMQDFQDSKIGTTEMLLYYIRLAPTIFVTVAPITLLLSTLYTLGRMSRTNELISMLGTGKSMLEVLRPIYLVGAFMAFLSMAFNYQWAPTAAGQMEQLLATSEAGKKNDVRIRGLMYRNNEGRRTWFVGSVPRDLRAPNKLRRVEIRQEDENGNLVESWWGNAYWWPPPVRSWTMYLGAHATYKDGKLVGMRPFSNEGVVADREDLPLTITETPWMLMSGALTPDFLGVPELLSYLSANKNQPSDKLSPYWTHFFYRFSLPWQCLVVVLFAAPLAVVFSRRGLVGGMTSAVLFFFVMLFFDNLFLNLGKSQFLPAFIAVWLPHFLLSAVGIGLFVMRSQNRELPKLSLKSLLPR
jgi:lipopolysaccharide export system permease protein